MHTLIKQSRRVAATAATIVLAVAAAAAARPATPVVTATASAEGPQPSDRWLKKLNAPHRQFFDAPTANGGVPLVHVMNYYDTYNKFYKVPDSDVDAVLTFYGATTFYGVKDAMWAKYRIGEFLETNDAATGAPAVRNPWWETPNILGMNMPQASIESLEKRGATFILCNNALQIFAGMLAAKRGLDATVVYNDLRNNILPGVELVPGMVIAVEQAARAGLTYHRQ